MRKPPLSLPIRITDAIRASFDGNFYFVEGPSGSHWFGLTDLIGSEAQVRDRIHRHTGGVLLTGDAIRSFQELVQNYPSMRDGVVAMHPGWAGDAYVCGDASVRTAPNMIQGVDIVSFTPLTKFVPRASLGEWQDAMTPFIANQVLPFFAVSVALSGPLLRFLPAEVMNPQIELVGPAKNGKSTLGTLAASVWSGNPNSTEGGGASWNLTAIAYDELRKAHRDMAIVLDEAEGSGTSGTGRAALASALIFAGATTASRRRYTDTKTAPDLRIPVLSTANTPLWEVLKSSPEDARQAALSRMFSIRVARRAREGGLRIFTKRPAGFSKVADAARALRNQVNVTYGTAGPAFAQVLVNQLAADPVRFRQDMFERFSTIRKRLSELAPRQDVRHLDMMAAIELTATLAQEGNVLPPTWGSPSSVVETVLGTLHTPETQQRMKLMRQWMAFGRRLKGLRSKGVIRREFIPSVGHIAPAYEAVQRPIGIFDDSCRFMLYYDPASFKKRFADHAELLTTARALGRLQTHRSEGDRLQIRAPKGSGRLEGNRVYAFDVTDLVKTP